MTKQELKDKLVDLSKNSQTSINCVECGHVYVLFSDGEMCSTKGGELFGKRGLHCLFNSCLSDESKKELDEVMTFKYSRYSCVIVSERTIAKEIHKEILKHFDILH